MASAIVRIDPHRRLGLIDPKVYGAFIEHLGRCIYGGIFEPGSPLSDEEGFRRDVLDAIRRLGPTNVRWPGGNFVSGYHWQDGVGPKDERPVRPNLAWMDTESNQFGTNEFIEFCRAVDAEPYICTNMGTGTMEEAAAWLEYCNTPSSTSYAELRRGHGCDAPHEVRYWGLGNEVFGWWQIGHTDATHYAEAAREFANLMRRVDPTIKLVACGAHDLEWDWKVLEVAGRLIDHISIHAYFVPAADDPYYSLVAWPAREDEYVKTLGQLIGEVRRRHDIRRPIRIAFDEWNVWYRTRDWRSTRLEEVYDLTDALCVAAFMNMLKRNCGVVEIANIAQLVNVIAPIMTSKDGMFLQTIYHAFFAQRHHSGPIALDAAVECDTFSPQDEPRLAVRYLDVAATLDEKGRKLFVSAVNLHRDEDMEVRLRLHDARPAAQGWLHLLTADDPSASNSFEQPDNVRLRRKRLAGLSDDCRVTLPPHSFGVVEMKLG